MKKKVHCSRYLKLSIPFVALFILNRKIQKKYFNAKKHVKKPYIHVVLTYEPVLWIILDRDHAVLL